VARIMERSSTKGAQILSGPRLERRDSAASFLLPPLALGCSSGLIDSFPPKTCQVRGSHPCRGATIFLARKASLQFTADHHSPLQFSSPLMSNCEVRNTMGAGRGLLDVLDLAQ